MVQFYQWLHCSFVDENTISGNIIVLPLILVYYALCTVIAPIYQKMPLGVKTKIIVSIQFCYSFLNTVYKSNFTFFFFFICKWYLFSLTNHLHFFYYTVLTVCAHYMELGITYTKYKYSKT
jgi:hypothetical protein